MTIKDPKFIITQDILTKCGEFAKNSVASSADNYARRKQFNLDKIIKDIRGGKIAEEGVYEKLSAIHPNISKPDYNIYDKKNKSWDPDLKDESGMHVAVKSQDIDSAINFGESWVFQFGNGGKYDCDAGVFKQIDPNHYVAFVALNVPKRFGTIRALVKIQWLHDKKMFKEMKKENLRGNKLAVYYDDLEKHLEELWQL